MGNSIDQNASSLLQQSKQEKQQAMDLARRLYVAFEDLEHPSLHVDYDFPRIQEGLSQMQNNLSALAEQVEYLASIGHHIDDVKATVRYIDAYGLYLARKIEAVRILLAKKKYEEGIILLHSIDVPDSLKTFRFSKIYAEIASFLVAELYMKLGERRIQDNQLPYSEEELASYRSAVALLKEGLHDRSEILRYKDHIRGIGFFMEYRKLQQSKLTPDCLSYYFDMVQAHMGRTYVCSKLTQWRYNLLRGKLIERYNEACHHYYDEEQDYHISLDLFKYRDFFRRELILHPAYAFSKDEEEFHAAFLRDDILHQEGDDFKLEAETILMSLAHPDDIGASSIADVYLDPKLTKQKKAWIEEILADEPFIKRVFFVEACFNHGASRRYERSLMKILALKSHHRRCDLELAAPSLVNIRGFLSNQSLPMFDRICASLYRSARATKITRKTEVEQVRTLSKKKVGLPIKSASGFKAVHARSLFGYIVLWFLAFLLPAGIIGGGIYAIISFVPKEYQGYAYAVLILLLHLYILCLINLHFGREERGAYIARRIIGIVSILGGVWSLVYFISPNLYPFFDGYGHTALIGSSLLALLSPLALKDHKRSLGLSIYLIALLVLIAAAAFLIIDIFHSVI